MAVPPAPTEGGGDKILFVVYDNTGTTAAALLRALDPVDNGNGDVVAHLAVASHVDGASLLGGDPVVLVAGSDGSTILKLLTDAAGALAVGGLGTAGSASGGVLTVQGVTSMTPLVVDASGETVTVEGVVEGAGTAGSPSGGVLTVQGASSMTPLAVSDAGLPLIPNVFKPLSAVTITSETTIWTPAGGKKFRLMGFVITQGTVTGDITLRDDTAGSTILVIPANAVGQSSGYVPLGNGILSSTIDHVLTAQGASTETISGFVFGREE